MFLILFTTLASKDGGEGFEDDLQITSNAPVVDIETIKTDDFFEIGNFTTTRNLPEASNARLNTDAAFVMGGVLLVFIDSWGTSTDERHAAFKDIKELR